MLLQRGTEKSQDKNKVCRYAVALVGFFKYMGTIWHRPKGRLLKTNKIQVRKQSGGKLKQRQEVDGWIQITNSFSFCAAPNY